MSKLTGIAGRKNNVAVVKLGFRPLDPETPVVVTLLSRKDIRATELQQIH